MDSTITMHLYVVQYTLKICVSTVDFFCDYDTVLIIW